MGNRAQIWPGPECLRTDPVLDVLGRCGALARTITIALAHERARARMARFVAWLVESPEWASLPWQRDPGVAHG